MERNDAKELAGRFIARAKEIEPSLEFTPGQVDRFDGLEVLRIQAVTPDDTPVGYELAVSLQGLANSLSKASNLTIVVMFGEKPSSSQTGDQPADEKEQEETPEEIARPVPLGKADWEKIQDFKRRGAYQEAKKAALDALAAAEELIPDDRRQALILESLIDILFRLQEFELGNPFLVRLLGMYSRCLGEDHLDTATLEHNAALFYQAWGRYDVAQHYYQRSHRTMSQVLGHDHPRVVEARSSFSGLEDRLAGESRQKKRQAGDLMKTSEHAAITDPAGQKSPDPQNLFDKEISYDLEDTLSLRPDLL